MTYHVSSIVNNSSKSIAITNPHPNPDGRDSRLTLPGTTYNPPAPIEVNFIKKQGTVSYQEAVLTALNVYTTRDNYCFWDNGNSTLNGVSEGSPSSINFYNGPAGNLTLTISSDGGVSFAASK